MKSTLTLKLDSRGPLKIDNSLLESSRGQQRIKDRLFNPPLKWAGGKRWLVPHVAPIWKEQKHRRYVEPFCGGLAMALGLRPQRALLNDVNPHLINFYQQVQRGLEVSVEMRNDEDTFYARRGSF